MFKKVIVYFLILIFSQSIGAQYKIQDIEDYIRNLDGMNLSEAKEYLKDEYQNLNDFQSFRKIFRIEKEDIQSIDKSEEMYQEPFLLSPSEVVEKNFQEYFDGLGFTQNYTSPNTTISVSSSSSVNLPGEVWYGSNALYYFDGSVDTTYFEWDSRYYSEIPSPKVIDSISITSNYDYITRVTKYNLTDNLAIDGGYIEVDCIDRNYVRLILSGTAKKARFIYALNEEGNILARSSFSRNVYNVEERLDIYVEALGSFFKKIDGFTSVEDIKNTIRKDFTDIPDLYKGLDKVSIEALFKGNIKSIQVYVVEEEKRITKEKVLVNRDACHQGLIYTYDSKSSSYGFMDQSGKFVIEPRHEYRHLQSINQLYFSKWIEDTETYEYYHLNVKDKSLDLMKDVDRLSRVNDEFVIKEKGNNKVLLNSAAEEVNSGMYDFIFTIENSDDLLVVGQRSTDLRGIMSVNGKFILPIQYYDVGSRLSDGLISVKPHKDQQHSLYVDVNGKTILAVDGYDYADPFYEGLAMVEIDKKMGVINIEGNLIIPCEYDRIAPFKEGVTLVRKNWKYGLLDKEGNVIIPVTASTYSEYALSEGILYCLDNTCYNYIEKKVVIKED